VEIYSSLCSKSRCDVGVGVCGGDRQSNEQFTFFTFMFLVCVQYRLCRALINYLFIHIFISFVLLLLLLLLLFVISTRLC